MSDNTQLEAPSTVLAVLAHPDDVDYGMSGTLSQWADRGSEIVYVIVTDGAAGGADPHLHNRMAELREAEQRAAAEVVGAKEVRFLGYPDGMLEVSLDLRRRLTREIREIRPDVVLTQSPERNLKRIYSAHPDHTATGEATLCAVYPDARNPYTFKDLVEEGLAAHTVGEVWLIGSNEPSLFVDISDVFERKVNALWCHQTQLSGRDLDAVRAALVEWGTRTALAGGLGQNSIAEAFLQIDTR